MTPVYTLGWAFLRYAVRDSGRKGGMAVWARFEEGRGLAEVGE